MLRSSTFWAGVIVGVLVPIGYHRLVKPIPTNKT